MFKKDFTHGIIAGILASIAGIIYSHVYLFANEADFSKIVNLFSIIGANMAACILIAFLHTAFVKWIRKNTEIFFNLTLSVLSFALIVIPVSITLPLNIEFPELFPGLVIPMLFYPSIAWFVINPIFSNQ
jgi:L-cystine uptake protein TcyP (sodium:dicarboxylate symporter family)